MGFYLYVGLWWWIRAGEIRGDVGYVVGKSVCVLDIVCVQLIGFVL